MTVYVLNREEQERRLSSLVLQSSSDGGWTKRYVHPASGDVWTLYYPHSEQHGGGPRVLRKEPVPAELVEWALQCVASEDRDDAIGAAYDLSSRPELWEEIVTVLERKRETLADEQIEAFVKLLGVLNPINRRPILGNALSDIERDAVYFKGVIRTRCESRRGSLTEIARAGMVELVDTGDLKGSEQAVAYGEMQRIRGVVTQTRARDCNWPYSAAGRCGQDWGNSESRRRSDGGLNVGFR